MTRCFECNSKRIVEIKAACPEGCKLYIGEEIFHEGDIPSDMNIGGPDEVSFEFCLACGLIQSDFPLDKTELEEEHDPSDED